jgi:hypothetical protein
MRLPEADVTVETGGAGSEKSFGIGNEGLALSILRDKLYSNPIRSICREISCNARDAHREVGTPDRPIEIYLPNALDPHLKIKDYGPGITPERMDNVFIMLCNSTKNGDNLQTGGFGLGAKTPFAYTTQFSVITITPEIWGGFECCKCKHKEAHPNIIWTGCSKCQSALIYAPEEVKVKRTYILYIDESMKGKRRLVREEPTTESCGTEIILGIEEDDWHRFIDDVVHETRFWDVKPILKGKNPEPEYPEIESKVLLETDKWTVYENSGWGYRESLAIVDGIAYSLDCHQIKLENAEELLRLGLHLRFDVGELTLSANREQVQYDRRTSEKVGEYLAEIQTKAKGMLEAQLKNTKTFKAAVEVFAAFKGTLGDTLPGNYEPKWRGHVCNSLDYAVDRKEPELLPMVEDFRLYRTRNGDMRTTKDDQPGGGVGVLTLRDNVYIVVNDVTNVMVPRTRVRRFLNEHPDIRTLRVLTFSGKRFKEGIANIKNWKLFSVGWLSDLPPEEKGERPARVHRPKSNAWQFDESHDATRTCDQKWSHTTADLEEGEGAYVLLDGKKIVHSCGVDKSNIQTFRKIFPDLEVTAVRLKDKDKLGDGWSPVLEVFRERVAEKLEADDITLEEIGDLIEGANHTLASNCSWLYNLVAFPAEKNRSKLPDDSPLAEYYDKSKAQTTAAKNYQLIWNLSHKLDHKDIGQKKKKSNTLSRMWKKVGERYPLLKHIENRYYSPTTITGAELVDYIVMVEETIARNAVAKKAAKSAA